MSIKVQAGNTVRLYCKFYDYEGNLINPSFVKITFYDHEYKKTLEQVLDARYRADVGIYFYDFRTEFEEKRYIYEFYGTIAGLPSIKRDDFITVFM
jgi:hypothetical protein